MDQFESPTAKDSQFFVAAAQEKAQEKYLFNCLFIYLFSVALEETRTKWRNQVYGWRQTTA